MTTGNPSSTATAPPSADTAAVAGVPQRIVDAWADHDPDAFAHVFTQDGSMILPGNYLKGRDAIRSFMATAFAGPYKGTQVTGRPLDARFLSKEAAVVTTQGGVLAPGETKVSDERAILATWVVVKQGEDWKLAAYQNCPQH